MPALQKSIHVQPSPQQMKAPQRNAKLKELTIFFGNAVAIAGDVSKEKAALLDNLKGNGEIVELLD